MRGKRTDIETKAKIHEMKINTNAQWSDIARELNIPERTVQNIIDTEFAEVCGNSSAVASLIDRNNSLQSAGDALIAELIASKDESITIAQLTTLRQSTFTQNQLLTWKVTERIDIWDYSTKTQKELEMIRQQELL